MYVSASPSIVDDLLRLIPTLLSRILPTPVGKAILLPSTSLITSRASVKNSLALHRNYHQTFFGVLVRLCSKLSVVQSCVLHRTDLILPFSAPEPVQVGRIFLAVIGVIFLGLGKACCQGHS